METTEFIAHLRHLSGDEINSIATSLRRDLETVDGELAWWRVTIAVNGCLRRLHRSREGGLAAHQAAQAVLAAATQAGRLDADRDAVTRVARAAADAARAFVAGQHEAVALLAPWATAAA
jgi:hypothetical protein